MTNTEEKPITASAPPENKRAAMRPTLDESGHIVPVNLEAWSDGQGGVSGQVGGAK